MLATDIKQRFSEQGYFTAEALLPQTLVEALRRDAEQLAAAQETDDRVILGEVYCGDSWYNYPPLLEYASFKQVAELPALMTLLQGLFHAQPQLVIWELMRIAPQQGGTAWHQDLHVLPEQAKVGITFYLHDPDRREGLLRVIPGSHQGEQSFGGEQMHQPLPPEIRLNISAQTAIVQDPLLWHSGSANFSTNNQWLLFLYYKFEN